MVISHTLTQGDTKELFLFSLNSGTRGGSEVQCWLGEATKRFIELPEELYREFKNASMLTKYSLTFFHMTTKLLHMSNTVEKKTLESHIISLTLHHSRLGCQKTPGGNARH